MGFGVFSSGGVGMGFSEVLGRDIVLYRSGVYEPVGGSASYVKDVVIGGGLCGVGDMLDVVCRYVRVGSGGSMFVDLGWGLVSGGYSGHIMTLFSGVSTSNVVTGKVRLVVTGVASIGLVNGVLNDLYVATGAPWLDYTFPGGINFGGLSYMKLRLRCTGTGTARFAGVEVILRKAV